MSQIPSTISYWWPKTHAQLSEWSHWSPSLGLKVAGAIPHPSEKLWWSTHSTVFSKEIPLSICLSLYLFCILSMSEEFKNHVNSLWLFTLTDVLQLSLEYEICNISVPSLHLIILVFVRCCRSSVAHFLFKNETLKCRMGYRQNALTRELNCVVLFRMFWTFYW